MTTLRREDFQRFLSGRDISVPVLSADEAFGAVDVRSADHAPRDGVIRGEAELARLWSGIDSLDSNGRSGSVDATAGNAVGRALSSLSRIADAPRLRVWEVQGGGATPTDNRIVVLGMNEGASHEVGTLQAAGHRATFITDAPTNDTVRAGGRTYDLSSSSDLSSFVATLGLPAEQSARIKRAIEGANEDTKDELAALATIWAKAEKGEVSPGRFVLSGHSVGGGVWGDENGYLEYEKLAALAEAMPRAARTVRHLHIAGCYSAGEEAVGGLRAIFPKLDTIWFYTGSAPGSYSGAEVHLKRWADATAHGETSLDRNIARGTRKGENVATWSIAGGYSDGTPLTPLSEVRQLVREHETAFARAFSGDAPVTDTQTGPLRDYYNALQRLAQHPELPREERATVRAKIEQTIRLIFYSAMIAPKFATNFGDEIRRGYREVGLPVPDFAALSRKSALAKIGEFEATLASGAGGPAARALRPLLTEGLRDLSSAHIPNNWV